MPHRRVVFFLLRARPVLRGRGKWYVLRSFTVSDSSIFSRVVSTRPLMGKMVGGDIRV